MRIKDTPYHELPREVRAAHETLGRVIQDTWEGCSLPDSGRFRSKAATLSNELQQKRPDSPGYWSTLSRISDLRESLDEQLMIKGASYRLPIKADNALIEAVTQEMSTKVSAGYSVELLMTDASATTFRPRGISFHVAPTHVGRRTAEDSWKLSAREYWHREDGMLPHTDALIPSFDRWTNCFMHIHEDSDHSGKGTKVLGTLELSTHSEAYSPTQAIADLKQLALTVATTELPKGIPADQLAKQWKDHGIQIDRSSSVNLYDFDFDY